MTDAVDGAPRILQPSAWRRAAIRLVVVSALLGAVLSGPVGALLPEGTRPWLPFLIVAAVTIAAIGGGLTLAYPRVLVDSSGALLVRGRTVPPHGIVGALRSLSAGGGLPSLVYRLQTSEGRGIRIMVAGGAPVQGLREPQLRLLRETIAASAIPVDADAAAVRRAMVGANVLGTGRRVRVDRGQLLEELDGILPPVAGAASADAVDAGLVEVPVGAESMAELIRAAELDDAAATRRIADLPAGRRRLRRVALVLLILAILACAALMGVMLAMEASGTHFRAFTEDPLVAALLCGFGAAAATALLWAIAADLHDAQLRGAARHWLETADPAERRRGIPAPFHRSLLRTPGGRMLTVGLFTLLLVAMVGIIAGFVLVLGTPSIPMLGASLLLVGVVLAVAAALGYRARRRAYARRVEWFVEAAGQRATGPGDGAASATR